MSPEAWRYLGQFNETHHRISRRVYYCHIHRLRTLAITYEGESMKKTKDLFLWSLLAGFVILWNAAAVFGIVTFGRIQGWWE